MGLKKAGIAQAMPVDFFYTVHRKSVDFNTSVQNAENLWIAGGLI